MIPNTPPWVRRDPPLLDDANALFWVAWAVFMALAIAAFFLVL